MSYTASFPKRRKENDGAYSTRTMASAGTSRSSRSSALAAQQAVSTAEKNSDRRAAQGEYAIQLPVFPISSLPPESVHKYLFHYALIPPFAHNARLPDGRSNPIIDYAQAVAPTPARKRKSPEEVEEWPAMETMIEELRQPAVEGQEPAEADARLCNIARQHWEVTQLRETETLVNFMYAIRMKDKLLKCPSL